MSAAASSAGIPLRAVDIAWLRMDTPQNPMVINGVLAFEERVELADVRRVVEERLLKIDRFRQQVARAAGGRKLCWTPDEGFDVERHLAEVELEAPGDDGALGRLVSQLMSEPLDSGRPLWHFTLVQGYGAGSALVGRLHHCIGDGIALMMVLLSLTDPEGGEAHAGGDSNPFLTLFHGDDPDFDAVRGLTERVMPAGMKLLLQPVDALRSTKRWMVNAASAGALGKLLVRRNDPKTVFKGGLGTEKRAAWSKAIDMDEVHGLRDRMGGTINDVLLTAMTGGLRRYIEARGESPEGVDFHAAVPVNLRPLARMGDLGNEFGLVFLALPVGIAHPESRLRELHRRMNALKRSAEPVAVFKILGLLGRSPGRVQSSMVNLLAQKVTAVMTNVPGPCERLRFAGKPISDFFFWVPQSGEVGLGVSILSYAGRVRLGVMTDRGLVPDPERVVAEFEAEFAHMCELGSSAASA